MRPRLTWLILAAIVLLAACSPVAPKQDQAPPATAALSPPASPTLCPLEPAIVPTRAPETPGYAELDPTTGLHMTGTAQEIDLDSYQLQISGKVDRPLNLTYDELRCMPKVEVHAVLVCPGFFQDEATWAGVPLRDILDRVGVQEDARGLRLVGADGYRNFVTIEEARAENSILAYEWDGELLPILHGFPVRAAFPELNGNRWVKWLIAIEVE